MKYSLATRRGGSHWTQEANEYCQYPEAKELYKNQEASKVPKFAMPILKVG